MTEHICTEIADRILTVRLNRLDKKNALTSAMYLALCDALRQADENPNVRVVLITGSNDCFSAGNDIVDFLKTPFGNENTPALKFLFALHELKKPLVAALNGFAIGIGTTLLLHCDLAYAADNAQFHLPFASLGLCPEAGSSYLMPRLMGNVRAAELLMLAEPFSAAKALEYGLINAVLPPAQVLEHARSKALRLAALPPNAIRTTKQLLKRGAHSAVAEIMRHEFSTFGEMLREPEAVEALTAFTEKRKPDFSKFS